MQEEALMPRVKIVKVRGGKRNGRSAPAKNTSAVPTPLRSSNRPKAEITPFTATQFQSSNASSNQRVPESPYISASKRTFSPKRSSLARKVMHDTIPRCQITTEYPERIPSANSLSFKNSIRLRRTLQPRPSAQ